MASKVKISILTFILTGIITLSVILIGCNSTGCTDNHSALPLAGFYSAGDEKSIQLDSIEIGGIGAPGDSLLIMSGQKASQVYFPFRITSDQTSFFIRYLYREQGLDNPGFNDTITFIYDAAPYFASVECGAMYRYTITEVITTHHLIDNVEITDSIITNVEQERIRILFKVSEPDDNDGTHYYSVTGGRGPSVR